MDELCCDNLCFKCVDMVFEAVCETSPVTTRAAKEFHCLVSSAYPSLRCDINARKDIDCNAFLQR